MNPSDHLLLGNIDKQEIAHFHQGKRIKSYSMSSSKQPPSCMENSLGTPWGLHVVCEKMGGGKFFGEIEFGFGVDKLYEFEWF